MIYIGITNDLKRRHSEHMRYDSWCNNDLNLEFFMVQSRCDAEFMEGFLISQCDSVQLKNVSKKDWGTFSFSIQLDEIPWIDFKIAKEVLANDYCLNKDVELKKSSFYKPCVIGNQLFNDFNIDKLKNTQESMFKILDIYNQYSGTGITLNKIEDLPFYLSLLLMQQNGLRKELETEKIKYKALKDYTENVLIQTR